MQEEFEVIKYSQIKKDIMSIYQEALVASNLFYKVFKLGECVSSIVNIPNINLFYHDIKIYFSSEDKSIPINYIINDEGHNHIVLDITANNNDSMLINCCYKELIKYYSNNENITITNIENKFINIYFHKKQTKTMPNDVEEFLYAYDLLENNNKLQIKNKIKEKFKISIQDLYENYLLKIHDIVVATYNIKDIQSEVLYGF